MSPHVCWVDADGRQDEEAGHSCQNGAHPEGFRDHVHQGPFVFRAGTVTPDEVQRNQQVPQQLMQEGQLSANSATGAGLSPDVDQVLSAASLDEDTCPLVMPPGALEAPDEQQQPQASHVVVAAQGAPAPHSSSGMDDQLLAAGLGGADFLLSEPLDVHPAQDQQQDQQQHIPLNTQQVFFL